MSRNFYALAATLGFLSLVSCGMTFVPSTFQPGLPANGSLWKTLSMLLLLLGLVSMLIGSRWTGGQKSGGGWSASGGRRIPESGSGL